MKKTLLRFLVCITHFGCRGRAGRTVYACTVVCMCALCRRRCDAKMCRPGSAVTYSLALYIAPNAAVLSSLVARPGCSTALPSRTFGRSQNVSPRKGAGFFFTDEGSPAGSRPRPAAPSSCHPPQPPTAHILSVVVRCNRGTYIQQYERYKMFMRMRCVFFRSFFLVEFRYFMMILMCFVFLF